MNSLSERLTGTGSCLAKLLNNFMRYSIVVFAGCLLIFWSCLSARMASHEVRKTYPTFYIGQFSWDAMIFRDSTLFRQSFSDAGPMMSDIFPIGNWQFINDSTIWCYNLKGRKKYPVTRTYYLDRIDTLTQVLVPDESLRYYRNSLQTEFHSWIADNPYKPAEADSLLNKSARFHAIMLNNHRQNMIRKYSGKFNDLKIYHGKGFN